MTHTKIQQKSNDSLHLLRFGRLKTDLKTQNHLYRKSMGAISYLQLPEKLKLSFLLADVYISLYIFLHFYICLCVFAYFLCVFVYIFGFSSYKIDSLISGGCRRRPPPISLSILYEENPKRYTKTHNKYANTQKHM